MDHHAAAEAVRLILPVPSPWLWWIPSLPLAAFTALILFGRRLGRASGWLAVAALAASFALVVSIASPVYHNHHLVLDWAWLSAQAPHWTVGLRVDGLSWIMLLVVTSIAPLIALYSIGYMHEDPREPRFFAYFSLFCASMLLLVLADHFLLLYAGWELVGLCSYLLISFWFEKPVAAAAGRKAFLTTRVGDAGLLFGILLLAWHVPAGLHFSNLELVRHQLSPERLTLISALIFFGAVGKSAQFPLHVWLPDAMEGPTPVSALIHAATMVAAGVYLVARTSVLFTPQSLTLVLGIGLTTHLFAGTIALAQTDIKRILAYSTLSQLGLMMTALGLGAASAAMFHLFTHAYFKALLFLGAGSVIHATHEQELAKLGGLRAAMPWTSTVFFLAALSMSGGIFLSGFWSKDAILLAALHTRPWLFWVLAASAVMTTAYAFRLYFRCFHGPAAAHGHGHAPHESPAVMVVPMALLAVGAVAAGWAGSPWFHPFFGFLGEAGHDFAPWMLLVSLAILGAGLWLAWSVGVQRRNWLPAALRPLGTRLYRLAANKYYVDEFYARAIIAPLVAAAEWLAVFDRVVIDAAVDGAGRLGDAVSRWKERFDRIVVDGCVNGIAAVVRGTGALVRLAQTGVIQQYLLIAAASVAVLAVMARR